MSFSKAFIFDLNGTIIDDMAYHEKVWHNMVTALGANITSDEMKAQMYGKNSELLQRIFGNNRFTQQELADLEMEKEKTYQQLYAPAMQAITGFQTFINQAYLQNIKMGIGSAAIMYNINFILQGLKIASYFTSIVSAEDVAVSKPHPETFLKAAAQLQVPPKNCIVFEDAPKGVEAAENAGMPCVVLTTLHSPKHFTAYNNILFFVKDYTDERLQTLLS